MNDPAFRFKGKRSNFKNKSALPLPIQLDEDETKRKHCGTFNGIWVEISDLEQESLEILHRNGCFGVSNVSQSTPNCLKTLKNTVDIPEKLVLFPEEAFFLQYSLDCLSICDSQGHDMSTEEVFKEFISIKPDFVSSFVAYMYLRSKNWVVKSGLKFAGDYLIYKRGPEFFHASFLVLVQKGSDEALLKPVQLQGIYRVAQTSGKDVLILEVTQNTVTQSPLEHLQDGFKSFCIAEMIPKRFIFK